MTPCVVISNSCSEIQPEDIIKGILEEDVLPEPLLILPEVRGYSWHINTKYYEADIQVCSLDRKSIGTEEFAEAVNAFILPFDSMLGDGLKVAEQWLTFIEELDPEIKILLCNYCTDEVNPATAVSKLDAQTWCVKNGFELVELNPVPITDESDLEDDFPESTGIKRVIQSLHAHVWSNLVMKGNGHQPIPLAGLQALNGLPGTSTNSSLLEVKVNGDSSNHSTTSNRTKLIAEVKPIPRDPIVQSNIAIVNPTQIISQNDGNTVGSSGSTGPPTSSSGEGNSFSLSSEADSRPSPIRDTRLDAIFQAMESMPEESFEELFNNLNEMKSKAESLSPSQRKEYAEKVAISFWKSVSGGNDSEVDISSDDD